MRLDLDEIAAVVKRDRDNRRFKASSKLTSPLTELRILSSMIAEIHTLFHCDSLELEDFADLRYRAVFIAIRALQARGEEVHVLAVADEIAARDEQRGTHVFDTVHVAFIGSMLVDGGRYRGELRLVDHDMTWLRKLAGKRVAA